MEVPYQVGEKHSDIFRGHFLELYRPLTKLLLFLLSEGLLAHGAMVLFYHVMLPVICSMIAPCLVK